MGGNYADPIDALGIPDYSNNKGAVSLGDGGELILQFTDNSLTTSGDEKPDLHIFEIGGATEWMIISISTDVISWIPLGELRGQPTSIDIDNVTGVVTGNKYSYVRIKDDPNRNQTGSPYGEADIDAVGAISSAPPEIRFDIVYVDDDAPNDPGPYDLTISDLLENGTREHPFDMIQEGIDAVSDEGTVVVFSGRYWETIDFMGKNIEVTGFDPDFPDDFRFPYPIVDGNDQGSVVTFNKGENSNCKLKGFVVTRGLGSPVLDSTDDLVLPTSTTLKATVRDFLDTHPDFEMKGSGYVETGIVSTSLGRDGKPVYAKGNGSSSPLTTGRANFDQWYRDVPGINMSSTLSLTLSDSDRDGIYTYSDTTFFPIDNRLFGNQGRSHNYHFTLELHSQFTYQPGQTFAFTGDDDLWVFINRRLAVDLGGHHSARSASLDLDTLGLVPDQIYDFDLFFAERHTTASQFRINTSIVLEPRAPVVSAIACIGASPQISNCLIVGNRCPDSGQVGANSFGGAIYCEESDAIFENCTIVDNYGGEYGAGIYLMNSDVIIGNLIIRGNTPEQIMVESGYDPVVVYSNIQGTWPGEGNIDEEPDFACPGYWTNPSDPDLLPVEPTHPYAFWMDGDYHLMSRKGRWEPNDVKWVQDEDMSSCIDKGDPDSSWSKENEPNGGRINVGAYGGTSQASLSWNGYTLWISSTEGGSVIEPGEGHFSYEKIQAIRIEAKADKGYRFTHWSGTAADAGKVDRPDWAETFMIVNADDTLKAHFVPIEYVTLTTSSTEGGSVKRPGEGTFVYECNEPANVIAKPEPCYHFTEWTGSAVDAKRVLDPNEPDTDVIMDANYTLEANFELNEYKLTIASGPNGHVEIPGEDTFTYDCNTIVQIQAIPDPGYFFSEWTGSAVVEGKVSKEKINNPYIIIVMDADYTVTAHFEQE
ncbi:MAG: fibro-slime domain-containing protein [Sedimentisphaerales bacterium]|nr:fibro-slime domain-containing protein [Sedimentisphaerales bacterium]